MTDRKAITQEYLRSILDYDPETGLWRWKERPVRAGFERTDRAWNTRRADTLAGTINFCGYLVINIFGIPRTAHRLAFVYMTGEAPSEVDHKDRDKANCRWENLRPSTSSQNGANAKRRSDNTSGHKGVTWYSPSAQWDVRVSHFYVGRFDSKQDAIAAYRKFAKMKYGEFARFD